MTGGEPAASSASLVLRRGVNCEEHGADDEELNERLPQQLYAAKTESTHP